MDPNNQELLTNKSTNRYVYLVIGVIILLLVFIGLFSNSQVASTIIALIPKTNKNSGVKEGEPQYKPKNTAAYEVIQPNWTTLDKSVTKEKIVSTAVANDKCAYMFIDTPVGASEDEINNILDALVNNKIMNYFIKVDKKEIKDNHIYIEGAFNSAAGDYYAAANGYFSSDRKNLYFMIFTALRQDFDSGCRDYMEETFNSFKLKNEK